MTAGNEGDDDSGENDSASDHTPAVVEEAATASATPTTAAKPVVATALDKELFLFSPADPAADLTSKGAAGI